MYCVSLSHILKTKAYIRVHIVCYTATLTLAPRLGNMLGGTPVRVAGLCLQATDEITCTFDGVEVEGVYMSEMIAMCISPQLTSIGRISFQMIVYMLTVEI